MQQSNELSGCKYICIVGSFLNLLFDCLLKRHANELFHVAAVDAVAISVILFLLLFGFYGGMALGMHIETAIFVHAGRNSSS